MHLSLDWAPFFEPIIKIGLPLVILAILVEVVKNIPYWIFDFRARAAGLDKVDFMTGDQFEVWLAHQFKLAGFKVQRTPYQGDHGADLILTGNNGVKIAVQAKKLSKRKDRVGAQALGEVLRGKKFYDCDKAMVVTNQGYTQQAREEARKIGIYLMDREKLIDFVKKTRNKNKD